MTRPTPDAPPDEEEKPDVPPVAAEEENSADVPSDVDDEDDGGDERPPARSALSAAERKAKSRKNQRVIRTGLRWTSDDPALLPFLNQPLCDLNLHLAASTSELAMVAKVDKFWSYLEKEGVFLPRYALATWNNMPDEAKVFAFLAMKETGIPWNIEQFNDKASAKLCKLRQKKENRTFRADMLHVKSVNAHPSSLWSPFRELNSDEEPDEEVWASKLSTAEAEIAALKSQLKVANEKSKLFVFTPYLYACN